MRSDYPQQPDMEEVIARIRRHQAAIDHSSESLAEGIRQGVERSTQDLTGTGLAIIVIARTMRIAHTAITLVSQRNPRYSDGRRLTKADNLGHGLMLSLDIFGTIALGIVLTERTNASHTPKKEMDDKEPSKKVTEVAIGTAGIGLCLIEAIRGRTVIKKRPLSRFGRIYDLALSAFASYRLGSLVRNYARS